MVPHSAGRPAKENLWKQFIQCCGALSEVVLLDRDLLARKREGQTVYYKTDLHWNQLGSFIAAQAIVANLRQTRPEIPPLRLDDMQMLPRRFQNGSDAQETALPELYSETEQALQPRSPLAVVEIAKAQVPARAESAKIVKSRAGNRLTVLVIHDSFGDHWPHFLPLSFGTVVAVTTRNILTEGEIAGLIDEWRPDVVIEEIVMNKLTIDPGHSVRSPNDSRQP